MPDHASLVLQTLSAKAYIPLKTRALARKLNITEDHYPDFRSTLKDLLAEGKIEQGRNGTVRITDPGATLIGTFRRTKNGSGYVRPQAVGNEPPLPDIFVREENSADASTGDRVQVKLLRKASTIADAAGEVVRILERATRTFVGTYIERDGDALVRVDGTVFAHSVSVGDAGAKGAKANDKVVFEMVRFPTADDRGEGVITEVLGPLHQPGVDLLSIVKAFGLPEEFPQAALAEAAAQADKFRETDLHGRNDFTQQLVLTVDPVDAKDFDDAVSVEIDPDTKHWVLWVHIADVAHFAPQGGALDSEAKKRATSIYLPQKVIPMFPEVISNGLASLQEGKVRYVKTVRMEFTQSLQKADVRLYNGAIQVRKRFAYEQLQAIFEGTYEDTIAPEILEMIKRMHTLAGLLRKKRLKRGVLELSMPEAVLEYDTNGKVSGAHFAKNDDSHRVIEDFMLAANEAVAEHFSRLGVPFLRRVHPQPNPEKLRQFAEFSGLLGYPIKRGGTDRLELQKVLKETAEKPERAAIHYALLRSLKQATYTPEVDEHYALASPDYCHFTSPIRRYPDLTVHRMFDRWVKTKQTNMDKEELKVLGDHCSKMERRAETAERELVKLKVLQYLSNRLGDRFKAVITGVADYGFFAQAEQFPAEGLVHVSSLQQDYYRFESDQHALIAGRSKKRFRLGDQVTVEVARVDVAKRMLDFRVVDEAPVIQKKLRSKKKRRR